ncbi:uncharacterized protein LOC121859252 [Homarus americanus]|uniref:uncharacterized protein LOC121859252 n=1 Tax=Homarus americanus TaxID=6706 RepID=UPI001C46A831|nr:uncharacterized protein LOC121859252 [Homarus americanus]
MESLISLALTRNNKVTTILSDLLGKEGSEGDIITGVKEYQRLADSTGGLLINTNKFDVHDIVNIIGGGVESSTVNIINLVGISGERLKVLPVDDSIVDLQVQITGAVNTAVIIDAKGITYNLMDKASLEAADNVEVVSYTNTFRAIKWTSPSYGQWNLTTNGPTSYSVEVFATSPLDFLAEFSVLDPSPPHPHYRHVTGRPLMNTVYYLELTLVGYLEGHVDDLDSIYFLDMKGYELRNIIYSGNVSDHMYIRTEPLPEESFFVCITGHLKTGKQYERVQVVLVTPVETSVEVWA